MHQTRRPPLIVAPARSLSQGGRRPTFASLLAVALVLPLTVPGATRRRYRLFGFEDADDFSLRVEGATDAA